MTYQQARFKDCISNTSAQFALFAGNKVKVQSVLYKFVAILVEVQLDPAEAGSFTVLDADESGYSMQSFKPASELTYNILPKSSAVELVCDNHAKSTSYLVLTPQHNQRAHSKQLPRLDCGFRFWLCITICPHLDCAYEKSPCSFSASLVA